MKTEMEIQNKNITELMKLASENPGLKIIPMVDSDVCSSDDYSYWAGGWGKARLDECHIDDGRIYFKYHDYEDLVSQCIDSLAYEPEMDNKTDQELEKIAEERVNELDWEKVIVVYIGTP